MKYYFLFSLLIFRASIALGQDKISMTMRDGSIMEGFAEIKSNDKIIFKKTEEGKKETYDYKKVKKLILQRGDSLKTFEFKIVERLENLTRSRVILLEPVITGPLILYKQHSFGMTYGPTMTAGGGISPFGFAGSSESISYYLGLNGEDTVKYIKDANTQSKRFKEVAEKYFSSCPDLLEKVNSNYFRKQDYRLVIDYYNDHCSKN